MRQNVDKFPHKMAILDGGRHPITWGHKKSTRLRDDGKIFRNGKWNGRYWYCRIGQGDTIIVRGDRVNDIEYLEALRWKLLLHMRNHTMRKYKDAYNRVKAADNPRFIRRDHVFHLERSGDGISERRVDASKTRSPMENLAASLTAVFVEGDEDWESGQNWCTAGGAARRMWNHIYKVDECLWSAIKNRVGHYTLYAPTHTNQPTTRMRINGRLYLIAGRSVRAEDGLSKHWPQPTDEIIEVNRSFLKEVDS